MNDDKANPHEEGRGGGFRTLANEIEKRAKGANSARNMHEMGLQYGSRESEE